MEKELSFFEQYLREAPGDDEPPDAGQGGGSDPPDMPDDAASDTGPPDMGDGGGDPPDMGDGGMDAPPDMGDGDFGMGDEDGQGGDEGSGDNEQQIDGLDEKVSAILNQQLYQKFLSMLNTIDGQLSQIRTNNDILYALAPDSLDISESLSKLEENIRTHLKEKFLNENYSANLLFFNKCLNVLDMLNSLFSKKIHKGIKAAE